MEYFLMLRLGLYILNGFIICQGDEDLFANNEFAVFCNTLEFGRELRARRFAKIQTRCYLRPKNGAAQ